MVNAEIGFSAVYSFPSFGLAPNTSLHSARQQICFGEEDFVRNGEKMKVLRRIKNLREKIKDPFVAEWALRRIEKQRDVFSEEVDTFIDEFFDDDIVGRLLRCELGEINHLTFRVLPPRCFLSHTKYLLENWRNLPDTTAKYATPVIAEFAPDKALGLFRDTFDSFSLGKDDMRIRGVMDGLKILAPNQGRELLRRYAPQHAWRVRRSREQRRRTDDLQDRCGFRGRVGFRGRPGPIIPPSRQAVQSR